MKLHLTNKQHGTEFFLRS